jgi:hypothetical protein
MKKLIITAAPSNASRSTALEYGFLLGEGAELRDYLEGLRKALFLTGAALQSAKVINGDCATEWQARSDRTPRSRMLPSVIGSSVWSKRGTA